MNVVYKFCILASESAPHQFFRRRKADEIATIEHCTGAIQM